MASTIQGNRRHTQEWLVRSLEQSSEVEMWKQWSEFNR